MTQRLLHLWQRLILMPPDGLSEEYWDWVLGEMEWYLEQIANGRYPFPGRCFSDPVAARLADFDCVRFETAARYWGKWHPALWW